MLFLVILAFLGAVTGAIGKYKGSSFFLWFLIGFVLPVIGTLAVIFYRFEQDEPLRRCPGCGRKVKLYEQVCMSCGTDLYFPGEPKPAAVPGSAAADVRGTPR